jgi:hypothetical protein
LIRIGLGARQKQQEITKYIEQHGITKVFVFSPKQFPLAIKVGEVALEHISYDDIIMYKFFYRLLEVIDEQTLLVFNECLRTQNRSDLTYNCAHHYCNQTPHRLVFEYFPFIDTKDDFMILLDFINKGKYKGKGFDYAYLQAEDISVKPCRIRVNTVPVTTSRADVERYEKRRDSLFDNLGQKDPDTIPRALQLLAGDIKKPAVDPDKLYVARNKRHKLDNVLSYSEVQGRGQYTIIDTHYRRLNFNDFLKITGMTRIDYLCTTLPIDTHIVSELTKWKARLDAIYAQANLY